MRLLPKPVSDPGAGSTIVDISSDGTSTTLTGTEGRLDTCTDLATAPFEVYVAGDAWGTQRAGVMKHVSRFGSVWNPPNVANAGVAEAPLGSGVTMAKRIVVTPDHITVAADATLAGKSVIGLWRILPDGKTDMTFGNGKGYTVTPLPQGEVVVRSMALDNDGRPIVVGSAGGKMFVARFWN